MGQKVNPNIIRLGIVKSWNSMWFYSKEELKKYIQEDFLIRNFLNNRFKYAQISKIIIERLITKIKINIFTARPELILGKKGVDLPYLNKLINKITIFTPIINITEIEKPEIDAQLIANNIAVSLEKRINYRILIKKAIENAKNEGIVGIKIKISGRLGGADIARTEWQKEGRIPLHTFRASIDYAIASALTTYGLIGIKVWIFKGEIYDKFSYVNLPKKIKVDKSS